MRELYLTIDAGTTSIKVCAVDEAFRVVACVSREYRLTAEGSRVTLRPEVYLEQAGCGIREVAAQLGEDRIVGIAVTTQGETLIPVDEQGNPLYDAVVWLDARADRQAEEIRALVPPDEFYRTTGVTECNGLCPISKLLWFKQEEPAVYEKAAYFFLLEDYLLHWLTGRAVTEKSVLCTTGYFDLHKDDIWEEILAKTGLDRSKIPEVLECGETVGVLRSKMAERLGLPEGIRVVTGAMDQVCGALGAGNYKPGVTTETTGTALCIGRTVRKGTAVTGDQIPVYRHFCPQLQLLLPVCMTAGMALKWFKDTFFDREAGEAAAAGEDIYDKLGCMAGKAAPLSGGMLMLPYLSGTLQPHYAPDFRGGFYNVGLECTREDFVRALFEGVGYMLKENLLLLDGMQEDGADRIISMGGGAKSPVWCQIKADITGKEIAVREESETASVGAAMLCALGLNKIRCIDELPDAGRIKNRYLPDKTNAAAYSEGFEKYVTVLEKLM